MVTVISLSVLSSPFISFPSLFGLDGYPREKGACKMASGEVLAGGSPSVNREGRESGE
jgi:hypothetical protein